MPMCIGLYQQYGFKGLEFYFWTQSFGRITGESQWRSNGGFFFMFHSFLWSFLPWSLFALGALVDKIKSVIQAKFKLNKNEELISVGGSVLSYASLSLSKYQLPHYIYVFFPLAAVASAPFIIKLWRKSHEKLSTGLKAWQISTLIVLIILWIVGGLLVFVVFGGGIIQGILFLIAVMVSVLFVFKQSLPFSKIIFAAICTAIGVNFFMNSFIYPSLLNYQPTKEIGRLLSEKVKAGAGIFTFDTFQSHSLDFYSGIIIPEYYDSVPALNKGVTYYCLTSQKGMEKIKGLYSFKLIKAYDFYPVTKVTFKFLNPATRPGVLEKRYLVEIRQN